MFKSLKNLAAYLNSPEWDQQSTKIFKTIFFIPDCVDSAPFADDEDQYLLQEHSGDEDAIEVEPIIESRHDRTARWAHEAIHEHRAELTAEFGHPLVRHARSRAFDHFDDPNYIHTRDWSFGLCHFDKFDIENKTLWHMHETDSSTCDCVIHRQYAYECEQGGAAHRLDITVEAAKRIVERRQENEAAQQLLKASTTTLISLSMHDEDDDSAAVLHKSPASLHLPALASTIAPSMTSSLDEESLYDADDEDDVEPPLPLMHDSPKPMSPVPALASSRSSISSIDSEIGTPSSAMSRVSSRIMSRAPSMTELLLPVTIHGSMAEVKDRGLGFWLARKGSVPNMVAVESDRFGRRSSLLNLVGQ